MQRPNMKSNNVIAKAIAGALALSAIAPSAAFAQTSTSARPDAMMGGVSVRAEVRNRICTAINARLDLVDSRFNEVRGSIRAHRDERRAGLDEKRDERAARVDARADASDSRRLGLYSRLEALADTDGERAAVAAFIKAVDDAVKTRRAAADNANADFRAAVSGAVDARRAAEESAVTAFRTAMSEAVLKAQQGCRAEDGGEEIRTQFQADVDAARQTFKDARRAVATVGETVRVAAEMRNAAIQNAMAAFKASLEQARADLKAAFGDNGDENGDSVDENQDDTEDDSNDNSNE